MEEAFRALLLANTAFMALVGTADRVVFGDAPQGRTYPLVTMLTVSGAQGHTMMGPDGLFQGRVQVDCLAASMIEAKRIGRAVVAAVDGHRGLATGGEFLGIFHDSTRDGREGGTNEADRPFRSSLDFMINWRNAG